MMSKKCCKHMENIRRVLKRYKHRRVTLLLQQCRKLEDVKIKKVCRDVVLVKHHGECMYVRICCICAVTPKCECECRCHHHHEHHCCDKCDKCDDCHEDFC